MLRVGYTLVAMLAALSLLKWYGFSPWTIADAISLISSIQWAHTIPPVILALAIVFRPSLLELLGRLRKFGYGDMYGEFDNSGAMRNWRKQLAVSFPRITVDDVRSLMKDVPYMNTATVDQDAASAHVWLLRNGITTKPLLQDLVAATEIHRVLAEIYIDELGRQTDVPLDANAVATWGAALFSYGPRDDVIEALRSQIAASAEAREYKARRTA